MMKAAVFSDTHSNTALMAEAVAQAFRFSKLVLATPTYNADVFPEIPLSSVRGNCDISSDAPDTDIVPLGPVKAFICHGHTYGVEYGRLDSLVYAAQEAGAKIAMFGHTHEAYYGEAGGVQLLNPGTAGKGRTLTWAVVTVFDNGAIACEIKEL